MTENPNQPRKFDFFDFDVITVDAEGKENSRRHYAHFFAEDLGNGFVLEMVSIPGGTFMMGFPSSETGQYYYIYEWNLHASQ